MGVIAQGLAVVANFFYGQAIPKSLSTPLIVLGIYGAYLLISSLILYYSLKAAGVQMDFLTGIPRALLTIFIRDIIMIPLILLIVVFPLAGVIIAIAVWLAVVKFIFNITWKQAFLAWIISLIIPFVIALFVLIPLAIILIAF